MVNLRQRFGRLLRHIRRQRDMTQEEFAELTGISVDFLSLIERGINAPSFETIDQVALRLNIPVRDLFDFSQEASAVLPIAPRRRRTRAPRTPRS
jgi:transcriptional regulator with XRE-family HTH domain